jgi:hypothetical protein
MLSNDKRAGATLRDVVSSKTGSAASFQRHVSSKCAVPQSHLRKAAVEQVSREGRDLCDGGAWHLQRNGS